MLFFLLFSYNILLIVILTLVATGFPSGQYPLTTRVDEVSFCVQNGASEVDIVIDRSLVLSGRWSELHEEVIDVYRLCQLV